MPRGKRRVKEEVWVAVAFCGLVVFALLADWWKENAAIGWTVIGVLSVLLVFFAYRYASFRGWLGRQVKSAAVKAVFEDVASDREPLSQYERAAVLRRSQSRCENERCKYQGKPHIHHIDMNNNNNNLANLIALCPFCHQQAHDGKFTQSQLFNWARRDYKRLQARRTQR